MTFPPFIADVDMDSDEENWDGMTMLLVMQGTPKLVLSQNLLDDQQPDTLP